MENLNVPDAMITGLKDSIDVNLYFNSSAVSTTSMTMIVVVAIVILLAAYMVVWHVTYQNV